MKAMYWYTKNAFSITADLCVSSRRAIDVLRSLVTQENDYIIREVIQQIQDALGAQESENEDE